MALNKLFEAVGDAALKAQVHLETALGRIVKVVISEADQSGQQQQQQRAKQQRQKAPPLSDNSNTTQ